MTAFTETPLDTDQSPTTIPGVVLARADAPPERPPGGYGTGWLLRTPLRAGGWLALALLWTIPVGLALAYWLTASPRRAALTTTAAGLLATGLHR
ncbi:MAG TPA: hypothetical protein VHF26_23750 [Trebonia sp.]|nr:hypothetical protein [Trebonia sp.]